MKTTIIILLTIGILTNLLKGADLLLYSHQKKWVQSKFETLTLWLEYTKPLSWYTKFTSKKGRSILLTFISLLLFYFWSPDLTIGSLSILPWLPVISLAVSLIFLRRYIVRMADWVLGDQSYPFVINRAFILGGITAISFNIFWMVIAVALRVMNDVTPDIQYVMWIVTVMLVILIMMPCIALGAELLFMLLCLTCIVFLLVIFEYALKLFRGIAWRIIEYDKGVYAALTLILTIGLGVALVVIKG